MWRGHDVLAGGLLLIFGSEGEVPMGVYIEVAVIITVIPRDLNTSGTSLAQLAGLVCGCWGTVGEDGRHVEGICANSMIIASERVAQNSRAFMVHNIHDTTRSQRFAGELCSLTGYIAEGRKWEEE